MSYIQVIGFETGDSSEIQSLTGTASIQTSIVRSGVYALRSNPTTTGTGYVQIQGHDATGAQFDFPGTSSVIFTSFYFRYATKPSSNDEPIVALFHSGAAMDLEVRLKSTGVLVAYSGTPTLLATGTTVLAQDTWYRIGIELHVGSGVAWAVEIDGIAEISGTVTASAILNLRLGKWTNRNGNTVDFYYDDLVVDNANKPPAGQILLLSPKADGTYTSWNIGAGSGSKYQQVDEIPHDGDTTYLISDNVNNHNYTATLQTSTDVGISGTVNCVKVWAILKRGTGGAIKLRLRSASTDSDATGATPPVAYSLSARFFNTDPATSSAWTVSGLDTLQSGLNNFSTTETTKLTATGVMVYYTLPVPVVVIPSLASLVLATFAPSIPLAEPETRSLTLTTFAPVITTPTGVPAATLRLTTYAPVVTISASTPVITGSLLQVDWNDDGDFADTGEDVTARLISSQDMTVVRGKDQLRLLSPPMAGAFNCELDNRSRDYSAENAGSPLFDKLFPGHKVRVTLETAATNYTVFTGVLDGIPQHPEFGNYTVELPSLGSLSKLRGKKVSTELLENVKTGEAINAVLDAADWSADERTIDDGQTTLLQFWANEEDAFDLVVSLMLTDGPGASVYENELGWFIFEDRHSRVILDRCTTSQFTFTDQDYIIPDAYEYDPGIRDVINACEVAVTTRTEKEQQVIWQYSKPLILGADEVRTITAQFNDPCKEIQVPDPSGGLNEVQRLTVLGTAPLIRLSYNDQQTGDLSLVSAGASAIQTALENLSSIGSGNVSVIRVMVAPDAIAFNIEFLNDLARMPIELLGVSAVGGTGKPVEAKVTHSTVGAVDDYRLLAGSLASVTLSRTSGQSVDITLTAGASGAYVDGLQLRGRPVTTDSQKRIANELDASVSQGKYGVRSYSPASRPEISEEEALQLADNVVRYYEEPRPTLVFAVEGVDGTVQLQQLTRQISDRITIQEAQTGINADFFIERISHRITEGPIIHTQFGCEKVGNLSVSGGGGSLWDTAVWDSAVYGS